MKSDWFGWAAVAVWLLLTVLLFWFLVNTSVTTDAPMNVYPTVVYPR